MINLNLLSTIGFRIKYGLTLICRGDNASHGKLLIVPGAPSCGTLRVFSRTIGMRVAHLRDIFGSEIFYFYL